MRPTSARSTMTAAAMPRSRPIRDPVALPVWSSYARRSSSSASAMEVMSRNDSGCRHQAGGSLDHAIDEFRCGMSVIQIAGLRGKRSVAIAVTLRHPIEVEKRLDDLLRGAQQRAGRLRLEVEVEAP